MLKIFLLQERGMGITYRLIKNTIRVRVATVVKSTVDLKILLLSFIESNFPLRSTRSKGSRRYRNNLNRGLMTKARKMLKCKRWMMTTTKNRTAHQSCRHKTIRGNSSKGNNSQVPTQSMSRIDKAFRYLTSFCST